MSQKFTTQDGITLIEPGAVVSVSVQGGQGAIASAGVVTLIGEADAGPGFLDESDLTANIFTPDQYSKVQSKYKSGHIVDAFKQLVSAANDPNILGSVGAVRVIKTNMSTKAAATMTQKVKGTPTYANVLAKKEGTDGNLIKQKSDVARAETAPTTGEICYTPSLSETTYVDLRINGGAKMSHTVTPKMAPDALVAALENIAEGVLATGGQEKILLPATSNFAASAIDASTLLVTLQATKLWTTIPSAGDIAVIPANGDYSAAQNSAIAGSSQENVGTYIVTAATNTSSSATVTLKKVYSSGALTSASGSVSADKRDLVFYSKIEIKNITGDERQAVQDVFGTYTVSINTGSSVKIDAPANLNVIPSIGDIMKVAATFGTVAAGFYQVTAATAASITASRLSEGSSIASVPASAAYASGAEPLVILAPVVSGLGKTLAIETLVSEIFKTEAGTDAGLSFKQLVSAAEYKNQMTITQGNNSEILQAGGDIVLTIGCAEEDATIDIGTESVDFYIASTMVFSATYKQYKTLTDLADFVNSQTNWAASVVSAKYSSVAPSKLDM